MNEHTFTYDSLEPKPFTRDLWPSFVRVRMEYDRAEWAKDPASVPPAREDEADVPVIVQGKPDFRYDALEEMMRDASRQRLEALLATRMPFPALQQDTPG